MKNAVLIGLLLIAGAAVSAQTVRTLGDLASVNNLAPFNLTLQGSVRYQVAYSAAELNVPGGAMITQVRIHGATIATMPVYGGFRLRMAHSTLTPLTITQTFDTNYTGTLEEVIGPATVSPTQAPGQNTYSWYAFPLTTPFFYNGTDTLVLDWSYDSISGSGFNVSSTAGRMRAYIRPANYQTPLADIYGDSGNHGIEFTMMDVSDIEVEYNAMPVTHTGVVNVGTALTQVGSAFTFSIGNGGPGDLHLTGTPAVDLVPNANIGTGTNVQSQPGLTVIPPTSTTNFTVLVEPAGPGPFSLLVSIPNSDGSKNPFEFTIEGNGILPNGPAFSDLAAGSVLTSSMAGLFGTDFDPGASLANVTIELLDPESDNIAVTAIDPPLVVPTGIVPPSIPGTPSHPVLLEWTGTADASNAPGDYTWTVHFEDAVNGTSVQAEVTITINDLPPVRAIANADSGSGTAADPYFTTFTQGDDNSVSVDMASVSDPNTSQALNVVNISPGANPTGGVGFQINFNAGIVSLAPNGSLSFDDAGTHTFTVEIGDGTNIEEVVLSALVYSTSGAITFDTPNPLPDGVVNQPYNLSLQVSGATAPTFNLQSGSLPTGVTMSASGVISGTPLATGMFTFTVRVLDGIDTATQQYDLEIKTAPPPPTSGTGGSGGSGGCAAAAGGGWLVLIALFALVAWRRRMA